MPREMQSQTLNSGLVPGQQSSPKKVLCLLEGQVCSISNPQLNTNNAHRDLTSKEVTTLMAKPLQRALIVCTKLPDILIKPQKLKVLCEKEKRICVLNEFAGTFWLQQSGG